MQTTDCPPFSLHPCVTTDAALTASFLRILEAHSRTNQACRAIDVLVAFIHRHGLAVPWNDLLDTIE